MFNLSARGEEVKFLSLTEISRTAHLVGQLVKRDFSIRFTGSALGFSWAVLQPLSLVALYWFVFTTFMVPRAGGTGAAYILFLISGLVPWLAINEGLVRSTTSIVENAAMVRRLPFQSEVLVVVPNVTAILFELIGLTVFSIFLFAQGSSLRGAWLLPFAVALQLLMQVGIGLALATLYVFFRDVIQVVGFALSVLFYLSPILYEAPPRFESFFMWNPLTPLLGLFRSALLNAPLPEAGSIVFLLAVAFSLFAAGLWLFRRAQGTLVDLI